MSELGVWDPLMPAQVAELFSSLDAPWWIAGGWAIDAFLGEQSRNHGDIDVGVLRRDQLKVQQQLAGWDLQAADRPGRLRRWQPGETLPLNVHDIWCRPSPEAAWGLQVMLDEAEADTWFYRRNPAVRRPLNSLYGRADGVPYIAPEVQLLYKAGSMSPANEADFAACLPRLESLQRAWLAMTLTVAHPGHPWIDRVDATFEPGPA